MEFFDGDQRVFCGCCTGCRTASHGLPHRPHHRLAHCHARTQASADTRRAAFVGGGNRNALRGVVLRQLIQVAGDIHADALIQHFLQCFRQRDVLHRELVQLQAVAGKGFRQLGFQLRAQLVLIRRHVDEGDAGLREQITHARHHHAAQLAVEVVHRVAFAAAGDFLVELGHIHQLVAIQAKCADLHHAEFLVADGDCLRRAPFAIQLQPGVEEIHIGLEGRFEQLVPVLQVGQQRQGLGVERVRAAGDEHIRHLALIDKQRQLAVAHRQLRAVLDLEILHRITAGEDAVLRVGPVDDVDKLLLDEIEQAHGGSPWR